MYPVIDKIEKQQVEEVFRLTGGELADKPLRFAEIWPSTAGRKYGVKRHWARYFYDGAPDYSDHNGPASNFLTIVTCELFGEMPKKILTSDGRTWRKVATYRSSGETECPQRQVDPGENDLTVTDERGRGWYAVQEQRCPLCDEPQGVQHGMIYLGDGWAEVVYRTRS